ncbi:MAG: hypothetical protein Ct9H90mP25_5280 [Gammaproteobacteria bacterium]|nr:MAG: hypothetical protein Ct9H90mP25_5280 [Gammaproteobacteria bacterium]
MAPAEVFPNKTFPDTSTRRLGIYFQDEIQIGDSPLTFIPGVRYDRYKMDATSSFARRNQQVAGFWLPGRRF